MDREVAGSPGRRVLNLGCGTKTSDHPDVTNVDWSIYLRLGRVRGVRRIAPHALGRLRRERLRRLPANIVAHDLRRGIPAPDRSVDVVYHSHLLEHLDRPAAPRFLAEVQRVLKPGGVHRIVVPDLESLSRDYLRHLDACAADPGELARHDDYVAEMLEQSVRREAVGMRGRRGAARALEMLLVGDARRRGETHQWMYDWANLSSLLIRGGFCEPAKRDFRTSRVAGWSEYGLDLDDAGGEYKPGSLFIEATKPP